MESARFILRNIIKNPLFSIVNIAGLTIAFASIFFIFLNVSYVSNYDKYHELGDRIYRISGKLVTADNESYHAKVGPALGPMMMEVFPEIENTCRMHVSEKVLFSQPNIDETFTEEMYHTDKSILKMFTLSLLFGSEDEALNGPDKLVLCESLAKKIFGEIDVVGNELMVDNKTCTVSAVMKDLPSNSHHNIKALMSLPVKFNNTNKMINSMGQEACWMPNCYTFILLREQSIIGTIESGFQDFYKQHMAGFGEKINTQFDLVPTPLYDLHFSRYFDFDLPKENYSYIYLLSAIGIFILIIAGINFLNLFSSTFVTRIKVLRIKKINGASSKGLLRTIFIELLIIVLASLVLGFGLVFLLKNHIESSFKLPIQHSPEVLITLAIIITLCLVILFSICYVPFAKLFISDSVPHIERLKSQRVSIFGKGTNQPFIVLQFVISIILISSTFIVKKQLNYIFDYDIGYEKENILMLDLKAPGMSPGRYHAFKSELDKSPLIESTAFSSHIPGENLNSFHLSVDKGGEEVRIIALDMLIDADYFSLMDMDMLKGNKFSGQPSSNERYAIINQAFVNTCGYGEDVINNKIEGLKITGFVNDAIYNSLHSKARPIVYIHAAPQGYGYLNIKLSASNIKAAIAFIKKAYNDVFHEQAPSLKFMDSTIEQMYQEDIRHGKYINIFSMLSIFISCLGLFGISVINFKNRIKEIGIRKVNGAKITEILAMLNKDFVKWVAIAFVIACPIAYYAMNKWLENFAYKTTLSWWIFALAGLLALGIALLTVSWQSWRAATRNPVEALRYE